MNSDGTSMYLYSQCAVINANAPVYPYNLYILPVIFVQRHNSSRQIESKALHATLVFVNRWSAVFLGIFGIAEEHAFVSAGLLFFAYATWLFKISNWTLQKVYVITFGAAAAGLRSIVALGPEGVAKRVSRCFQELERWTYTLELPL